MYTNFEFQEKIKVQFENLKNILQSAGKKINLDAIHKLHIAVRGWGLWRCYARA